MDRLGFLRPYRSLFGLCLPGAGAQGKNGGTNPSSFSWENGSGIRSQGGFVGLVLLRLPGEQGSCRPDPTECRETGLFKTRSGETEPEIEEKKWKSPIFPENGRKWKISLCGQVYSQALKTGEAREFMQESLSGQMSFHEGQLPKQWRFTLKYQWVFRCRKSPRR